MALIPPCLLPISPLGWLLAQGFTQASASTAALVRTTVAVTQMHAGVADNVLPQQATLTFNFRSYPGEGLSRLMGM